LIDKIRNHQISQDEINDLLRRAAPQKYLERKKGDLAREKLRYGEKHPDHNDAPHVKNAFYKRLGDFINKNFS
jgi:hypothetical protein